VSFDWNRGGGGGGTALFTWRQSGGSRRWDVEIDDDGHREGDFSVESNVPADAFVTGERVPVCSWTENASTPEEASVVCFADGLAGDISGGIGAVVEAALDSPITGRMPDRNIAGVLASCYTYRSYTEDMFCVDATGVPLYWRGTPRLQSAVQEIRATQVSRGPATATLPAGLPFGGSFNDSELRPLSSLDLPMHER
jgi:hypothetical protein